MAAARGSARIQKSNQPASRSTSPDRPRGERLEGRGLVAYGAANESNGCESVPFKPLFRFRVFIDTSSLASGIDHQDIKAFDFLHRASGDPLKVTI